MLALVQKSILHRTFVLQGNFARLGMSELLGMIARQGMITRLGMSVLQGMMLLQGMSAHLGTLQGKPYFHLLVTTALPHSNCVQFVG